MDLQALAEKARAELGDALTGRIGRGVRPPGRVAAAEVDAGRLFCI
jgi:hypothetical protein